MALLAVAVLLSACSFVTFEGDTAGQQSTSTVTLPPATATTSARQPPGGRGSAEDEPLASEELCARLPGVPFAERRLLLSQHPDGPEAATEDCPQELAAIEQLEAIATQSAELDDDSWFDQALAEWDCTDRRLTASVRNIFDFPIRLIVVTQLIADPSQQIVGTGWTVTEPVDPDSVAAVAIDYRPGPVLTPELTCNLSAQAFIALEGAGVDSDVTDTWDAELGFADPPPDTSGDDWARLLPLILSAEQQVEASGDWARAAAYEDVRSKNYKALVDGAVGSVAVDFEVVDVCGVERVADELRAVTWIQEGPGGQGVVLGVFHRSAVDDRWRWVHTGIFLSGLDGDCRLVQPQTA